jgi:hypothetical protein
MATTTTFRRWGIVLLSGLFSAGASVAACNNSNSNPQPTPVFQVDSGIDSSVDTGTPAADSAPGADATETGQDGGLEDGELLPDQSAEACTSDAGCWSCIPTSPPQFLNQCTASQCSPFANAQRLPDYDGSLPPLN